MTFSQRLAPSFFHAVQDSVRRRMADAGLDAVLTDDPEDVAYLQGQPDPPPRKLYLAVFMTVENEGDTAQDVPTEFTVVDTEGTEFQPLPSDSLFALDLGAKLAPDEELPEPESTAANGPIQGAMILFRIDSAAIQDRPLTLDIPSSSGTVGHVELDI
jgi:hypothetical protein